VLLQQGDLLEHQPGRDLSQPDQKLAEASRPLCVLGVELLVGDLAQDFLASLGVVKLGGEEGDKLGHRLRKVLGVLQVLHNSHLHACELKSGGSVAGEGQVQ
jgi:hypothetical protein